MKHLIRSRALVAPSVLACLVALPQAAQGQVTSAAGVVMATTATWQTPVDKPVDKPVEKPVDKTGDYNVDKKGLALDGYDPVAYFQEFGGQAKKGDKSITTKHEGVIYRFSSEANKKAFLADPSRFLPMYGGWCAWAMADGKGDKVEIDPKSFTIEDGRLYVFFDGFFADTRKSWKKKGGAPKLKTMADTNWTRLSGEAARAGDTPKPAPKPADKKK
ncbi:YHS domain protein [Planctomycetes bacterium Poly30]|uniref:YHS domain protein n=1 Tax=Saltatorellus ferox TaxID=2528018 RepID=A0A518ERM0_9BACT|nr:YHS domain protein [Planctomycetes bacterium Poly30]